MTQPYITLELTHEAQALRITLNRPEVLNALSLDLLGELRDALTDAAADKDVRAVLLMGSGRGFSSGADLGNVSPDMGIGRIIDEYYNPVVRAIVTMTKPVIAAVNGVAAGAGMSLALACDMRLVSSEAVFTVGFTRIGLVMDASASYFLPRLVGRGRTFELAYSGRKVTADEAISLGLAETLLPAEGFSEAAWDFTKTLAAGPTRSFAMVKEQLNASPHNTFEDQLALEARLQTEAGKTADVREGIMAFAQKRPATFRGE